MCTGQGDRACAYSRVYRSRHCKRATWIVNSYLLTPTVPRPRPEGQLIRCARAKVTVLVLTAERTTAATGQTKCAGREARLAGGSTGCEESAVSPDSTIPLLEVERGGRPARLEGRPTISQRGGQVRLRGLPTRLGLDGGGSANSL